MRDKYENEVSFERMKQGLSKRAKFRDDDVDVRFERKQKQKQNRKNNRRTNREEADEYEY
jgi:hypothetical protein